MKYKLAILATHPIQYQAPWFRALASHPAVDLEVLFGHRPKPSEQAAAGFGVPFEWDTPLLDGYRHRFLRNVAAKPGVNQFFGVDTPEIAGLIAENRYDAVIVNGWHFKSAWQAFMACWNHGIPVMARGDSHLHTRRSAGKRVVKAAMYRCFIPRFDACLPVGKWSEEYFVRYGARGDRVFFVPHVLDEGGFRARLEGGESRRLERRAAWGLDPSAVVYLFSGKLISKKRPLDFIRAVALAAKAGVNVQGLIVGDGTLRGECEAMVKDSGSPVRFAGFLNQSEIVDSYLAADSLVLASDGRETWGMVVQEAMFCGRPAFVSAEVGCGPDLVDPGVTGDRFECDNPASSADCLIRYANSVRLREMGAAARARVARYSIREAVEGVLRALDALAARRAA